MKHSFSVLQYSNLKHMVNTNNNADSLIYRVAQFNGPNFDLNTCNSRKTKYFWLKFYTRVSNTLPFCLLVEILDRAIIASSMAF